MFFVTTSPSQMPLAGSMAQPGMPGVMPMMADGTFAGMGGMASNNMAAAAPPSYEAIVLDPNGPRSQTNLFVRKLASAVKEEDLKAMFEQYGAIMSFALMRDIHTGESLGTAFVRYRTHDEARAAMAGLDGTELYGRPISIQWAKKEHDGTPCGDARRKIHKLFVRNIPLSVTARHLRQVFAQFGSINNVTLHSDTAPAMPKDAPPEAQAEHMRNIAFILFQEDGAAERAVSALHNTCPFPSCEGIPLMVKLAEDNRDRLGRKQKTDNTVLPPGLPAQFIMAANGQPGTTLSNPVSATISPAQLSLDGNAALLQANMAQGLPFSMATAANGAAGPTAGGAPMLQATTDMNGNTTYVYVNAPSANAAAASRLMTAPAQGPYFVQTPNGLQAISAASMQTIFAGQSPASAMASLTPPQQHLQQQQQQQQPMGQQSFFPSITMPPLFVDTQGNPISTIQSNMLMQNFFPAFNAQQQQQQQQQQQILLQQQMMMAQQQQQQQQQQFSQMPTPTAKRSSLPSFAEAATAAGNYPGMTPSSHTTTPTNGPFTRSVNGTGLAKNGSERSPMAAHLAQQPYPDMMSAHSVSPQLSSAASNTNLLATAASSAVVTPMDGGMALPTNTLLPAYSSPPRTLVPLAAVPAGVEDDQHLSENHPLFNYDALRMNDANASLTATSSMTVANDAAMNAMALGIEDDDMTDSDSEADGRKTAMAM